MRNMEGRNKYEELREANIERNNAAFRSLNLPSMLVPNAATRTTTRKQKVISLLCLFHVTNNFVHIFNAFYETI